MSNLLVAALVLLAGCGVKKNDAVTTPVVPQALAVSTPKGLFVGKTGKYVLAASSMNFIPREDNAIVYRIATADLDPLNAPEYSLQIEYDMPSMKMEGLTLSMKNLPDGKIEVTYEGIAHGGEWEVRFKIVRAGQVLDTISYRVTVPMKPPR